MKTTKTYPFSAKKHMHDIEYYYNHCNNVISDMLNGEIPYDADRFDRISDMLDTQLEDLYSAMFCGTPVVYLTGKQIALAKKIVVWAQEHRAGHLRASGKTEYIQYCYG
jgi:hypothetical protein